MRWLIRLLIWLRLITDKPNKITNVEVFVDMKTVTINWELPTTRQQGGTLDPADIQHVVWELSADGGTNYGQIGVVVPGAPQTIQQTDLEFGTWHFRGRLVLTDGQASAWHEEVVQIADDSPPNTLVNVTVTVS